MKTKLRQKYKYLRRSLPQEMCTKFSKSICDTILKQFSLEKKNVSTFYPITQFSEVDTRHLLSLPNIDYYLPVMTGNTLKHIKYESEAQLKVNHWGIPEPEYGVEIDASQFDFIIIPLLAYDQFGNRVGYGKGFYDGFLQNCSKNCIFIGVSYFEPEETKIETIDTDIALHYCITPKNIHQF